MNTAATLILLTLYTAALAAGLWQAYKWLNPPEVVTETEIEYVDRVIEKRDTVTVDRPVVRTIYEQQTDTVEVRIPVPVGFTRAGVISPTPVRIDGRDITLTYWAPDSLRFIQDRYVVERPKWGAWVDTGAARFGGLWTADVIAHLRFRWLTIFGGYGAAYGNQLEAVGPVYGARIKIWGTN